MKKQDNIYIRNTALWASNEMDTIRRIEEGIKSNKRCITRNLKRISLHKEGLNDVLEEHNKWRAENKLPKLQKFAGDALKV